MVKRLGLNLQDALNKIKNENQHEYTDLFQKLEQKLNTSIKAISEDTNTFGLKWDNELQRFQMLLKKKQEDDESRLR